MRFVALAVGVVVVVLCIVFVVIQILIDRRRDRRQAVRAQWIIAELYGNRDRWGVLSRRWSRTGQEHDDDTHAGLRG
jgi:hypothetical protein